MPRGRVGEAQRRRLLLEILTLADVFGVRGLGFSDFLTLADDFGT
jgi:hypothetical protein